MSEWIKCSDKMPECGQEVIVYWDYLKSGIYEINDATYDDNGLFFVHKDNFNISTMDVIDWMPKPILEPPKGVMI